MRNAQRIAAGATAIAAGMALWVMTPTILEEERATGIRDVAVVDNTEASANDAKAMLLHPPPLSFHLQAMNAICVHLPVPAPRIRSLSRFAKPYRNGTRTCQRVKHIPWRPTIDQLRCSVADESESQASAVEVERSDCRESQP